ncbi:MAG: class I mannose-6-phosphate isomerase [Verrucomicrobiaceae bacterium]|nr:class I mannose-6-phosphate isomerase [Verrucomicrobiaceae bacterium]
MNFDHPLTFTPLYKHRIWGGRLLEQKLGRHLPADTLIGESWEIVDRPDDQSVVADGPLAGITLHELWTEHRTAVFGEGAPDSPRFPLLAKILDAKEKLSVQVHPPAQVAAQMNAGRQLVGVDVGVAASAGSQSLCDPKDSEGAQRASGPPKGGTPTDRTPTEPVAEPKTEMWYLLDAEPDAELFVGFRNGVTRDSFAASLKTGACAELLHRIPVRQGDFIFIPSGRCHAIGAGCFIIEIQQNSDTTYRVFDWNRTDASGKPRELHIDESLRSMDFNDHEPALDRADGETLVSCDYFRVDRWTLRGPRRDDEAIGSIFTVVEGSVRCGGREFRRGDFFLLPACAADRTITPASEVATLLRSAAV